jgi:chemotaxis response regulator CheB
MLEAQAKDSSAPALKPDQVEALSHLPAVSAVVTELADLLASLKKFEQSQNDVLLSHHRKFQSDLRDAEAAKQAAVREAEERGREEARAETKSVLGFLRFASYQREVQSPSSPEGAAVESVLIGVYQGGEKAFETALKLSEGAREPVGADSTFTCNKPLSTPISIFMIVGI